MRGRRRWRRSASPGAACWRCRACGHALGHGGSRPRRRPGPSAASGLTARHLDLQVDAVEQRPRQRVRGSAPPASGVQRQLLPVRRRRRGSRRGRGSSPPPAGSAPGTSACRAAREMVMRPVSSGSRSASSAARGELGQLVEEQHAVVRQRDLARPRRRRRRRPAPPRWPNGAARETAAGRSAPASKPALASPCSAALASASSSSIGGRMPGRRCASIDLPVPGGPIISRLCPPAAAISSARLAPAWPFTSRRSAAAGAAAGAALGARQRQRRRRPAAATAPPAAGCRAARMSRRAAPAPRPRRCLRRQHQVRARVARARQRQRQRAAHRPQLAGQRQLAGELVARPALPASIWPAAARMPSAIGRSKRPDSLGRSAGARLTVMRLLCGNAKPALLQRGAHPLARFLDFGVGQAHQREAGQAVGQVHLDRHRLGLQGVECAAVDDGEGHGFCIMPVPSQERAPTCAHRHDASWCASARLWARARASRSEAGAGSPNWRNGMVSA